MQLDLTHVELVQLNTLVQSRIGQILNSGAAEGDHPTAQSNRNYLAELRVINTKLERVILYNQYTG